MHACNSLCTYATTVQPSVSHGLMRTWLSVRGDNINTSSSVSSGTKRRAKGFVLTRQRRKDAYRVSRPGHRGTVHVILCPWRGSHPPRCPRAHAWSSTLYRWSRTHSSAAATSCRCRLKTTSGRHLLKPAACGGVEVPREDACVERTLLVFT